MSEPRLPLVDLRRAGAGTAAAVSAALERVAASGSYVLGPELAAFESAWAEYCGVAHAVGVGSGTDALVLALRALGAGPGTEVVTTPLTFFATVEAVLLAGARPVLVDVDARTRCLDPAGVAAAVGRRTAAVLPVHLYGRAAPIREIAHAAGGVPVLEDAAQAHGAALEGRRVGSWGAAAAFSFYPTKNLGALGDGGAVVTSDARLAARVRALRHHGSAPGEPNRHQEAGLASRLDELQAAVLRARLVELDRANEARRAAVGAYRVALEGLPVTLPPPPGPGAVDAPHLFVIEVEARDAVLDSLRSQGVGAAVHYPTPVHLQPALEGLGHRPGDFPVAERLADRVLSLPLFPGITEAEIARVARALRNALLSARRPAARPARARSAAPRPGAR